MGNSLYKELNEMDKRFTKDTERILGKGLLTQSSLISSSRILMVSSNIEQGVNLKNSTKPKYFTAYENMFGAYSEDAYYKAPGDYVVISKIDKYVDKPNHIYTLILQCVKTGTIHIIEKKQVEDLAEYYGFEYDTTKMDSQEEGDVIDKDTILYKSKSFDDSMNFKYGMNVKNMYLCLTENTEDAIIISNSLKEKLDSVEVETIEVSININDTLTNLYDGKAFPDIGEHIVDRIIANVRRIDFSQVAYSLSAENLSTIQNNDQSYYTSNKNSEIIDINIYSNNGNWDFENSQVKEYYNNQCSYQRKVLDVLSKYKDDGIELTDEALHMYNYFSDALNEDINWTSNGKEFNNIIIEFLVKCDSKVEIGSKLVGRYGDKGVVAAIYPDEKMPITENGIRAEMISTGDGVVGRLNPGQLFETECNFIGDRIIERLRKDNASLEQCKTDLLDFLSMCSSDYGDYMNRCINSMSEENQLITINNMMNDLTIHSSPDLSNKTMNINILKKIYEKFNVEKYRMYTTCRGRRVEMFNKFVLGDKYIIRLKHTPKSKFSARSVYKINNKRQPCKSKDVKQNKIPHSKTPVRFGEMEFAIIASAMPDKVCELMDLHTAVGSTEMLYTTNLNTECIEPTRGVNRSFEILNIYFNTMGISLDVINSKGSGLFVNEIDPDVIYSTGQHVNEPTEEVIENYHTVIEPVMTKITEYR